MMKRTPLKRKSKKIADRDRLRAVLVSEELVKRPWCEAGGQVRLASDGKCGHLQRRPASELHEPKTRARGGSILNRANTVSICRECHTWVHDHPAAAHEAGLLKHSWEVEDV